MTGRVSAVLRQTLRPDRIIRHWDDINRLAASFQDGLVRPSLVTGASLEGGEAGAP
jgi:hypothetical protein